MPKRISRLRQGFQANEKGIQLDDKGDDAHALACYREAIRLRPEWATPWYNIGLLHKYKREWRESIEANLQAARIDPTNKGAIWNLGIAATALGDWGQARGAWKLYGIDIDDGDGPVDYPIGDTPVRVALDTNPAVIWTRRIDPARAIVESVPLPASGRRYGDQLLHDGAPNGYRKLGTREVPVFDELQVLRASAYSTFEAVVESSVPEDFDSLQATFDLGHVGVENWTTNFRVLCKACSEGRPFDDGGHDHDEKAANEGSWRLGIAALEAVQAQRALDDWLSTKPTLRLTSFNCVLDARLTLQMESKQ